MANISGPHAQAKIRFSCCKAANIAATTVFVRAARVHSSSRYVRIAASNG